MKYRVIIPKKDLRRDTMRAGGPGGQHQNKTESAVRYTHVPSGISAESRGDKSQHRNDGLALELLHEKLLRLWLIQRGKSIKGAWERKPDVSFGAKMRSVVMCGSTPRVVDHETGWQGNPRAVLNGGIDELLRARLEAAFREQWDACPGE